MERPVKDVHGELEGMARRLDEIGSELTPWSLERLDEVADQAWRGRTLGALDTARSALINAYCILSTTIRDELPPIEVPANDYD